MASKHTILLTGGAGFIGTHILSMFPDTQFVVADIQSPQQRQLNAIYIRADIRSEADTLPLFEKYRFDCVWHLAAAHKDFGIEQEEYFTTNVNGTQNICNLAAEFGVNNIVFYSSVAVYGDAATPTCDDTEPHPSNDYGLSKLRAEEVLKVWREGDAANRKLLIIRPTLVYGEGNLANMYRLIDAIATGRYFNVGAGENIKSIAYVKNLVEATWYLFNRLPNGLFVGNYSDQPHLKTAEIVSVIASQLGKPIPKSIPKNLLLLMAKPFDLVISLTGKDLPISSMRVKKMGTQTFHQAELVFKQGFRPQFNTIEGLQRMVEWYKLHQLQKRKYKSPA